MNIKPALIPLFAAAIFLSACGGGGESSQEESTEEVASELPAVLQRGVVLYDMSDHFMDFSLYVPDSARGIPEVEDTGYGQMILRVGKTYNVLIAEGGDVSAKKDEITNDIMYKNTIVEEGPDFILFKSEIDGSFLDPEFHFYAVKDINGIQYEFADNKDEGPFAESVARLMLESVNHVEVNNPAS